MALTCTPLSHPELFSFFFFFQAEDGIRDKLVTGVQTCALPISASLAQSARDMRGASGYTPASRIRRPPSPPSTGSWFAGQVTSLTPSRRAILGNIQRSHVSRASCEGTGRRWQDWQ